MKGSSRNPIAIRVTTSPRQPPSLGTWSCSTIEAEQGGRRCDQTIVDDYVWWVAERSMTSDAPVTPLCSKKSFRFQFPFPCSVKSAANFSSSQGTKHLHGEIELPTDQHAAPRGGFGAWLWDPAHALGRPLWRTDSAPCRCHNAVRSVQEEGVVRRGQATCKIFPVRWSTPTSTGADEEAQ